MTNITETLDKPYRSEAQARADMALRVSVAPRADTGEFRDRYDCMAAWMLADKYHAELTEKCKQLEALVDWAHKESMSQNGFEDIHGFLQEAVIEFQTQLKKWRVQLDEAEIG